jgi:hypothetical protein
MGAVQVLCVAAAGFSRMAEGTRFERGGHLLCLTALAVIADSVASRSSSALILRPSALPRWP